MKRVQDVVELVVVDGFVAVRDSPYGRRRIKGRYQTSIRNERVLVKQPTPAALWTTIHHRQIDPTALVQVSVLLSHQLHICNVEVQSVTADRRSAGVLAFSHDCLRRAP